MQVRRCAPEHDDADRHHEVGDDGGHRDHGGQLAPAAEKEQKNEGHEQIEPHRGPRDPEARMHSAQYFGHRIAPLHGVDHAGGRGGVSSAGAAGADEGIGVQQDGEPIEIEGERQLSERRAVFERRPALVQVLRRHRAEECNLQHQIDHRAQRDRAEDCKGHAPPRIARLAGKVHRALEAVVAEDDAAGGNRGEDGGDVPDVPAAVNADAEILPMKAGAHQRHGGGRGHDQLEESDGAVGIGKDFHAPEIEQEIDHHQRSGNGQSGQGQLTLAIGSMHIQVMRPRPGPGTHVLHRCLGLHGDHRDDGDPGRPAGEETDHRAMRIVSVAHRAAGLRKHGAELGIGEGDEQNDHRADDPGVDGAGTGQLGGAPGTEKPSRSDDRTQTGEHQSDRSDFAANRTLIGHASFSLASTVAARRGSRHAN